jgi:hypothetical protein
MKIKFLHVPKTAGTSVRRFLSRFFLSRHVCPAINNEQFQALSPEQLRSYRLFAGHIDWTSLDRIEGECFTFSILRQPRERLVSFYFFLRAQASKLDPVALATPEKRGLHAAITLSPDAFFCDGGSPEVRKHLDSVLDNFYTYYFAEGSYDARRRMRAGLTISDAELLARVEHNLGRLDGLYSIDDLASLEKDVIDVCGRRGIGWWGTLHARFSALRDIKLNSGAGSYASRLDALKSLGATHRTFDRIEEMTRLDDVIWNRLAPEHRPRSR